MIKSIILNLAVINWCVGMILIFFTDDADLIAKTNYKRTGWLKYKMGYSMKEIRKAIELTEDKELKKRLQRKITIRKVAYGLFISTPILIVIGNI